MVRTLSPEKKEAFLRSALRLFVAKGIEHTSTAEIAKETSAASGTLFLYFPTKQDLIHELVLKIAREQSAVLNALLRPELSVRDTFFTIWDGSVRWFLANMDAYRFNQQTRDSHIVAESIIQETAKYLGYYFIAIQRGLEAGLIHPYPLEMIGGFLYQDIVAVMNLISAQPDPVQQNALIQSGFDIFWNGIKNER